MSSSPIPHEHIPSEISERLIAIDSNGNASTELTRKKESVIRREQLNRDNPVVVIDLETILAQDDGEAISIVVQDFGLPPRVININGDFIRHNDVQNLTRDQEHYTQAPKTLTLTAPSIEQDNSIGRTYVFDDRTLPTHAYEPLTLQRRNSGSDSYGRGSMLWAHDGAPSDERNGYIEGFYGLVALSEGDYYYSGTFEGELPELRGMTPYIGITYEGKSLYIYSLDDTHADVLYQQVRSLEDEMPHQGLPEQTGSGFDLTRLLSQLEGADDVVIQAIETLSTEHSEAIIALAAVQKQLHESARSNDALETYLATNKTKLSEARREVADLSRQVEILSRQGPRSSQTQDTRDQTINDLLGSKRATEADPHGHLASIGVTPDFLLNLDPVTAKKMLTGVHRALAQRYHSDGGDESDDEKMKRINTAVDSIHERIEKGYWGRH